jgi:hypothetical protein
LQKEGTVARIRCCYFEKFKFGERKIESDFSRTQNRRYTKSHLRAFKGIKLTVQTLQRPSKRLSLTNRDPYYHATIRDECNLVILAKRDFASGNPDQERSVEAVFVGVHVRRTDYMEWMSRTLQEDLLDERFFEATMKRMKKEIREKEEETGKVS